VLVCIHFSRSHSTSLWAKCAFIAMADVGGHGVDEYLESNFQLPEEVCYLSGSLSLIHSFLHI
jgi:hypothetical protein